MCQRHFYFTLTLISLCPVETWLSIMVHYSTLHHFGVRDRQGVVCLQIKTFKSIISITALSIWSYLYDVLVALQFCPAGDHLLHTVFPDLSYKLQNESVLPTFHLWAVCFSSWRWFNMTVQTWLKLIWSLSQIDFFFLIIPQHRLFHINLSISFYATTHTPPTSLPARALSK